MPKRSAHVAGLKAVGLIHQPMPLIRIGYLEQSLVQAIKLRPDSLVGILANFADASVGRRERVTGSVPNVEAGEMLNGIANGRGHADNVCVLGELGVG